MIKGITIILLFYFLGECLSFLIHGWIPGSVCGMVLLFLSLMINWINPHSVQPVAGALTKNMALFFGPAGVGLMTSFDLISKYWAALLVIISITTWLIIAVVGWLQETMEKKNI